MSGIDENIEIIADKARRSTDLEVKLDAIRMIASSIPGHSFEFKKSAILAIIRIGKTAPWPESTDLAYEKITEIVNGLSQPS